MLSSSSFPLSMAGGGKNRPALIVQHDRDNQRLTNTVVAMISGNVRHAGQSTQVLVDPTKPNGASSGLHGLSVVKCNNLLTIRQQDVQRIVGHLSDLLLRDVNDSLKAALDL